MRYYITDGKQAQATIMINRLRMLVSKHGWL